MAETELTTFVSPSEILKGSGMGETVDDFTSPSSILGDIGGENTVMFTEEGGRIYELERTGEEGMDLQGRPIVQYGYESPDFSSTDQAFIKNLLQGVPFQTALEQSKEPQEPQTRRSKYSEEMGFGLASEAAQGVFKSGEGVVDIPDTMPLYQEGGAEVSFPSGVQEVGERAGNAALTILGTLGGIYGYGAGGVGDLLQSLGIDPNTADRTSRMLASLPEAFAGSAPVSRAGAATQPTRKALPAPPKALPAPQKALPAPSRALPEGTPVSGQILPDVEQFPPATQRIDIETPDGAQAAAQRIRETATSFDDMDAKIGDLIRKGAGFGIGARRARQELAKLIQINPEAKAAADRLGIDVPLDIVSDSRQIQQAIGATRSISGSEASAVWRDDLLKITEAADRAIVDLAGATDLSTVSQRVLNTLEATKNALKDKAQAIYDAVDNAVPRKTIFSPENIVIALNETIEEMGGINQLNKAEKRLYDMVTDPDQPVTYAALMRQKNLIGRALQGDIRDNPFGTADSRALGRLYDAIKKDQMVNVERVGGSELAQNLDLANKLWSQQSDLGTQIISAFGKDKQGSLASKLRSAVTSAKKGDVSGLNRTLKLIPKDLRREAVLSAVREVASSTQAGERGFGFAQFSDFYSSMRRNPEVYKIVASNIGREADVVLRDLYEISRRVTDARANVFATGRANQPLIQNMAAEGLIGRVLQSSLGKRTVRGMGTGLGATAGGPMGAVVGDALGDLITAGRPDRMQNASRLFRNNDFKLLVEEVGSGSYPNSKTIKKVASSKEFRKWAKANEIDNPMAWLTSEIAAVTKVQEVERNEEQ